MNYRAEQEWKHLRDQALFRAEELKKLLLQGKELDIEISPQLFAKLDILQKQTSSINRKLRIALIGGFSGGKTSIAAGLLGRIDGSMKINQSESSDSIEIYETDFCEIVDTPGLFGFEKKENGERFHELTRKYISEADLILYVMDPINSIKNTHTEELKWILRTLNLLPRTVFVLGRFDEVADMDDIQEWQHNLNIKKDNVLKRLKEDILPDMTDSKAEKIPIVAVCANPDGKGFSHWLNNPKEYRALSHINELQQATQQIIDREGGDKQIILQTQGSILRDVIHGVIPSAEIKFRNIQTETDKLQKLCRVMIEEMERTQSKLREQRIELRTSLTEYLAGLNSQIESLTLETFREFFIKEIGDDAIIVENKIKNLFDTYCNGCQENLSKMEHSFNNETNHFIELLQTYGKPFLQHVGKVDAGIVKTARNYFCPSVKFAPWGAVKMANKANLTMAGITVAITAWEFYDNYRKNEELKKYKKNLEEYLSAILKEICEEINSPDFFQKYGNLKDLTQRVQKVQITCTEWEKKNNTFAQWKENCKQLEKEIYLQLPQGTNS